MSSNAGASWVSSGTLAPDGEAETVGRRCYCVAVRFDVRWGQAAEGLDDHVDGLALGHPVVPDKGAPGVEVEREVERCWHVAPVAAGHESIGERVADGCHAGGYSQLVHLSGEGM